MTNALKLIRHQVVEEKATEFTVPARLLQECDLELIERGVLTFTGKHQQRTRCPECGNTLDVEVSSDQYGQVRYSVLCPYCEAFEDRVIEPQDVELLDYNHRQLLLFINDETTFGDYVNEASKCVLPEATVFKPKRTSKESPPMKDPSFNYEKGRFEYTDDFHDIRLTDQNHRWQKFTPYCNLGKPTAAHDAIVAVMKAYQSLKTEGWVKSDDSWHSSFLYRYAAVHRFKAQQIQVGSKSNHHLGEWRIIPDIEFDEHYRRQISRR